MTDQSELEQAMGEMLGVLDAKFANLPEWRAFRAIDRALAAMRNGSAPTVPPKAIPDSPARSPKRNSYVELGLRAIKQAGVPLPTERMMEYIGKHRQLSGDPKKVRINVQSSFSKDPRLRSIAWQGGRAWWFSDKDIPPNPAGGSR